MHFWSQNLNERRIGGGKTEYGSKLREGRATLYFSERSRFRLSWSWMFFKRGFFHAYVDADGNGDGKDVTFALALPWLFAIWFSIEWPTLTRWLRLDYESAKRREARGREAASINGSDPHHVVSGCYDMDRRLGISYYEGTIRWSIWWRQDYSSSRDPKWRHGYFSLVDFFLGDVKHSKEILQTAEVRIPLPEGTYDATVEIDRSTWRRPRWFAKRRTGSYVSIPKGIPIPGKGENSYDCGPDALFGKSGPETTVEGAIAGVVKSVLADRVRRGASHDYAERD